MTARPEDGPVIIKVNCPNCGVRLSAQTGLEGKPVNCQKCNTKFVLSRRWAMEALGDSLSAVHEADDHLTADRPASDSDGSSSAKSIRLLLDEGQVVEPLIDTVTADSFNLLPSSTIASESSTPSPRREHRYAHFETLKNYNEATSFWELFDFRFQRYLTPHIIRVSWFLILLAITAWLLVVSYFFLSSVINREPFSLPEIRDASAVAGNVSNKSSIALPQFFFNSAKYLTMVFTWIVALIWIRVGFETIITVFKIGGELRNRKR